MGLEPDGVALTRVSRAAEGRPRLELCEFLRGDSAEERGALLAEAVRRLGLAGSPCVCVLPFDAYALRLIEAPDVPPDELRSAVRWMLADLVDFEVEDAAVDVVPLPEEPSARVRRLHAVAAPRTAVAEAAQLVRAAGLALEAIELPELALRNLVGALPGAEAGWAVLQALPKGAHLTVIEAGHLRLSREIGVSWSQLEDEAARAEPDDLVSSGALEDLALEIQRSLDYYEREFRRAPPARLAVAPAEMDWEPVLPRLAQNLTVNVRLLELGEVLECPQHLSHSLQARCLAAVGAALRSPELAQVDLRPAEREGPRDWLAPPAMLAAYGALLGLLAVGSGVSAWSHARLRSEVEALEAQHAVRAARVEELGAQLSARGQDAALKVRVAALSAERDTKVRLLRQLSGESLGNTRGWSSYLEALGRHPIAGLWLREIRIDRGGLGLALSGTSLEAEGVPRLLQDLSEEEPYAGKRFRTFRIDRSKARPGGVDFFLGTEADGES